MKSVFVISCLLLALALLQMSSQRAAAGGDDSDDESLPDYGFEVDEDNLPDFDGDYGYRNGGGYYAESDNESEKSEVDNGPDRGNGGGYAAYDSDSDSSVGTGQGYGEVDYASDGSNFNRRKREVEQPVNETSVGRQHNK